MLQRTPDLYHRFAALAVSGAACLVLAACGSTRSGSGFSTVTSEIGVATATAATAAQVASRTPPPTFTASWLRGATPASIFPSPAAVADAAPAAVPTGWKQFTSDDGGFSVWMPGTPKANSQTVQTLAGPLVLHTYLYEGTTSAYYAGYADYPASVIANADVQRLLDGARDGAVANVGGTLLSEKDVTMAGFPAREITIKAKSQDVPQGIVIVARVSQADLRQYQLEALSAGQPSAADSARFEAFFESFSVTR